MSSLKKSCSNQELRHRRSLRLAKLFLIKDLTAATLDLNGNFTNYAAKTWIYGDALMHLLLDVINRQSLTT